MSTRMLLSGNHAAAHGARLARPQVIPIYPITPQTPIAEKITDFCSEGEMEAEIITVDSEHTAMSAAITASLAGTRVFTATASQGLMLMHEMLHFASGARAPIVMVNVNRTIGSPWGFWPDQTDSVAQRDTGWMQFYSETAQEALDTAIQAFKVSEAVSLPTMVMHDAFYVSHSLEEVEVPDQTLVDQYLPPYKPEHYLDPDRGESWGNVVNQDMYWRHKRDMDLAMQQAITVAREADSLWQSMTGRGYGIVEAYRLEDAEIVIATMGSMAGTTRVAVDELRQEGIAAGLFKLKMLRPFPVEAVCQLLGGVPQVLVLDRNYSPGMGGALHQELKAALYGLKSSPKVHGYLAGVGGINVSPAKIKSFVQQAMAEEAKAESLWVR